MKIIPKVYQFIGLYRDGRIQPSRIVARSAVNAERRFKQLYNESDEQITQYCICQENWLANILILSLPKYTYRGGAWSEWKKYNADL